MEITNIVSRIETMFFTSRYTSHRVRNIKENWRFYYVSCWIGFHLDKILGLSSSRSEIGLTRLHRVNIPFRCQCWQLLKRQYGMSLHFCSGRYIAAMHRILMSHTSIGYFFGSIFYASQSKPPLCATRADWIDFQFEWDFSLSWTTDNHKVGKIERER